MIGIDIISISRFAEIKSGDYIYWDKNFTKEEWHYCFSGVNAPEHLAAIFSIKEAVMKAVGGDIVRRYDRIEVGHAPDGSPYVIIDHTLAPLSVSTSHEGVSCVSVAIRNK